MTGTTYTDDIDKGAWNEGKPWSEHELLDLRYAEHGHTLERSACHPLRSQCHMAARTSFIDRFALVIENNRPRTENIGLEPKVSRAGRHNTDLVVGRNIRVFRLAKHMSQQALAKRLGVSFQQVQKYENGTNRVGASRLLQIAEAIGVAVHSFFEGTSSDTPSRDVSSEGKSPLELIAHPQAFRLVRAFDRIEHSATRRSVVSLLEAIAGDENEASSGAQ